MKQAWVITYYVHYNTMSEANHKIERVCLSQEGAVRYCQAHPWTIKEYRYVTSDVYPTERDNETRKMTRWFRIERADLSE